MPTKKASTSNAGPAKKSAPSAAKKAGPSAKTQAPSHSHKKVAAKATKATKETKVTKTATKAPVKAAKPSGKAVTQATTTKQAVSAKAKPVAAKPAATAKKPNTLATGKPSAKASAKPSVATAKQAPVTKKGQTEPAVVNNHAKLNYMGTMGIPPYLEQSGEEYMNELQQAHFRKILLSWKRQLMEEVDRTVHHMQDEAANFPDPNDRATQEEEFSLELRTRDRERKLIKKIDEALQKIEGNDYGFCDACGIEIGIRRLEARPTATLCIDCKTLDEIKERQMGGNGG